MHSAVVPLLRFVVRNALQLLIVVVILVAGKEALDQWRTLPTAQADHAALQISSDRVRDYRYKAVAETLSGIDRMRNAPVEILDARIAKVDSARHAIELASQAPILTLPLSAVNRIPGRIAEHYQRLVEAELLRQESIYLTQLRTLVVKAQSRRAGVTRLEQLRLAHVSLYKAYSSTVDQLGSEKSAHKILRWVPRTSTALKIKGQTDSEAYLALKVRDADKAYREQSNALAALGTAEPIESFHVDHQRLDALLAPLHGTVNEAKEIAAGNWLSRLIASLVKAMPAAFAVLITGCAGHFAIKAFLFYILAPMATRAPPICLDPAASGTVLSRSPELSPTGKMTIKSAVSTEIRLSTDEEMLILPDFVQSSRASGNKDTKWLLDWSCPWTSLVSGMYALERIRPTPEEVIVVSAGDDPFCEIACLSLPAGTAMVFQPRGMVGVIYPSATPLKITRRWRLFSLHAWLTLQLRFLVFAGPVTLIVKGNRGVRVEPANRGQTIRQAATLGFSANLRYSTVRCETFYPFYAGKTALLQDRFAEVSGYYVYDETPAGSRGAGKGERGLEGVLDATLKVFGI